MCSSLGTEFYNPKTFLTHAALLHQAFAHCGKFPTAASRRSLGRVSVPVWPVTLSGRLPIEALVGRYLTNKLMGRRPIHRWVTPFHRAPCGAWCLSGISRAFVLLSRSCGQVAYALLTRPPLSSGASPRESHDLHVLGTPPAFVLSQDQTLSQNGRGSFLWLFM